MLEDRDALLDAALDLAWSLWGQVGVSTWRRSHKTWSVEVEPLMVFTSFLAEHDPRLLRESIDWCAAHDTFLSVSQFRRVATAESWPAREPVERYGATLSRHSRRRWPAGDDAQPYDIELSGKSRLPDLRGPAATQLRLRALMGVSARAEILRVLLIDPWREWSVAEIAERVAYTRRQINTDLEMLALSGLTRRTQRTGSFVYAIEAVDEAVRLFGPAPEVTPRWTPLFASLATLLEMTRPAPSLTRPAMEVSRRLRELEPVLERARVRPPRPHSEETYIEDVSRWARHLFVSLAQEDASMLPGAARTATSTTSPRADSPTA
jgi:hypothetical protein